MTLVAVAAAPAAAAAAAAPRLTQHTLEDSPPCNQTRICAFKQHISQQHVTNTQHACIPQDTQRISQDAIFFTWCNFLQILCFHTPLHF